MYKLVRLPWRLLKALFIVCAVLIISIPNLAMPVWLVMLWGIKMAAKFLLHFVLPLVIANYIYGFHEIAGLISYGIALICIFHIIRWPAYWFFSDVEIMAMPKHKKSAVNAIEETRRKDIKRQEKIKTMELETEARRIHGDARFMLLDRMEALGLASPDGVEVGSFLLGLTYKDRMKKEALWLGYKGNSHMLTIAKTGAGKGVSLIIPNLLEYEGSVFMIDPKGENTAITARARRESLGQEVFVLNPFQKWTGEPWNLPCNSFNPIDRITLDNPNYMTDVMLIAESLIPKGEGDSHWNDGARNMVEAILLYIGLCEDKPELKNLLTLRRISSYSQKNLEAFFKECVEVLPTAGTQDIAMRFTEMNIKEFNSFRSIISGALKFLSFPEMENILLKSDFKAEDLKEKNITVSIVLPANKMKMCSGWMRLMVDLCLEAVQESEVKPEHNVLFLVDEAATLGYSKNISQAFGLMRGNGLRVWPIFQNLGQIQKIYKEKEWESFISGSCLQLFGVNDYNTAKYFCDTFGNYGTVQSSHTAGSQTGSSAGENEGENKSGNSFGSQRGKSKNESLGKTRSIVKRALITPDELMRYPSDVMVCRIEGENPLTIWKVRYYEQNSMIELSDPNPYRDD